MRLEEEGKRRRKRQEKEYGNEVVFIYLCPPEGGWATPSSTAILGQPVEQVKQASFLVPPDKNWSNVGGK